MFHSYSLEEQAYYLSRIIYRDTEIENYHSEEAVMDRKLYNEMYAVVDKNVKTVLQFHQKLLKIRNKQDVDNEMRAISASEQIALKDYALGFYAVTICKPNWDPPEKLALPEKPEDFAQFILGGRFIECCEKHCNLSDPVMCDINKDVHNRIYTLLCENLLPGK